MTPNRNVSVVVKGSKKVKAKVAGGHISEGLPSENGVSELDSDVRLRIDDSDEVDVRESGGNIAEVDTVVSALDELQALFSSNLTNEKQIEIITNTINQLKLQTEKPVEEREQPRIKNLLGGLKEYIGAGILAADLLNRAQPWFEQVVHFFLPK
jgi:hypothetical protein